MGYVRIAERMKNKIIKSKRTQAIFFLGIFVGFSLLTYLVLPSLFMFVFQVLRILLIILAFLFIFLSLLVLIGLREQAKIIIGRVIDGSLTSIDIYEAIQRFAKNLSKKIKKLLKNLAPLYAFIINIYLYFFLIFLFKYVGTIYDVTVFTIILTLALVLVTAFLTKPSKKPKDYDSFRDSFVANFTDFFEITLFVFFLTIDSTSLFFLPDGLNTELVANIGSYDLMIRGINIYNNFGITLNIILFIFIIEVLRNALGFYVLAKKYASEMEKANYKGDDSILKTSIKQSLYRNMDDIIKFITYITFVVFVFLFFPRLKLLAMATASLGALIADFIFTQRLTATTGKKQDLIGKILARIFRI